MILRFLVLGSFKAQCYLQVPLHLSLLLSWDYPSCFCDLSLSKKMASESRGSFYVLEPDQLSSSGSQQYSSNMWLNLMRLITKLWSPGRTFFLIKKKPTLQLHWVLAHLPGCLQLKSNIFLQEPRWWKAQSYLSPVGTLKFKAPGRAPPKLGSWMLYYCSAEQLPSCQASQNKLSKLWWWMFAGTRGSY